MPFTAPVTAARFILGALLLLSCISTGRSQEVSLLGGSLSRAGDRTTTYAWELEYKQDFYDNMAASMAYINEGHLPGHRRDGDAWQGWVNRPLAGSDRLTLSLGAGVYYYYDTQQLPTGSWANTHGAAPILSFSLTGTPDDAIFYQFMYNHIDPPGRMRTDSFSLGLGYRFGPGVEHAKTASLPQEDETDTQFTVLSGRTVVNTFAGHIIAVPVETELRTGLAPHLDGTASLLYEGDSNLEDRHGVAFQLWPVTVLPSSGLSVGFGVGPYAYTDRSHSLKVTALSSLTVARDVSEHWNVRLIWDRVTTHYSRDSDIFLAGLGYCWR
jgi:hypothetical protein